MPSGRTLILSAPERARREGCSCVDTVRVDAAPLPSNGVVAPVVVAGSHCAATVRAGQG